MEIGVIVRGKQSKRLFKVVAHCDGVRENVCELLENGKRYYFSDDELDIMFTNDFLTALRLLENSAEEIENLYGKETDLTIQIRKFLNDQKRGV